MTLLRLEKKNRVSRSAAGNVGVFAVLMLVGTVIALPLIYTAVTAFKPINELFLFPPRFFVKRPTMDNFSVMMSVARESWVPFERYLFNSVFVAGCGTAVYIFIASLAAYPLAKHPFPGRGVYSKIIVWAILFRPEVTGVCVYIILAKLGMINTYGALILPAVASSFGVFLMRQFIVGFPDTVLEAARIDGAGELKIYWSIVMPSVKPAWVTLIIFTFQGFWNTTGMNFIYNEKLKMLPAILSQIVTAGIGRAGAGAAVALFLMIPPIVIFIVSQSSVLETMAHSGIKE